MNEQQALFTEAPFLFTNGSIVNTGRDTESLVPVIVPAPAALGPLLNFWGLCPIQEGRHYPLSAALQEGTVTLQGTLLAKNLVLQHCLQKKCNWVLRPILTQKQKMLYIIDYQLINIVPAFVFSF